MACALGRLSKLVNSQSSEFFHLRLEESKICRPYTAPLGFLGGEARVLGCSLVGIVVWLVGFLGGEGVGGGCLFFPFP